MQSVERASREVALQQLEQSHRSRLYPPLDSPLQRPENSIICFYETDSHIQQSVQETKLTANISETHLHQRIVLAFESLVGRPVHAFGLASLPIQDASLPAQPLANLVSFGGCPVPNALLLRGVGQSTTLTAGKVPARRVQHGHPFAALGAGEPVSLSAQVADCCLGLHPLLDKLSGAFNAVGQHQGIVFNPNADARHRLVVKQPLPAKTCTRLQQPFSADFSDVQRHGIIRLRFAVVVAPSPTSASAHFYSPDFAEII